MRLAGTALLVAVAAVLVALSVVNREAVTLRLDPFGVAPEAVVTLPLYAVIFGAVASGVVVGGAAATIARRTARRPSRRRRGQAPAVPHLPAPIEAPARPRRRRSFLTSR